MEKPLYRILDFAWKNLKEKKKKIQGVHLCLASSNCPRLLKFPPKNNNSLLKNGVVLLLLYFLFYLFISLLKKGGLKLPPPRPPPQTLPLRVPMEDRIWHYSEGNFTWLGFQSLFAIWLFNPSSLLHLWICSTFSHPCSSCFWAYHFKASMINNWLYALLKCKELGEADKQIFWGNLRFQEFQYRLLYNSHQNKFVNIKICHSLSYLYSTLV